jgi:hypothetical protein
MPVAFKRNGMTGRAILKVGDGTAVLASPWNPMTHVGLSTTTRWVAQLAGREFTVVKERARFFGGTRNCQVVILADGVEVASAVGY